MNWNPRLLYRKIFNSEEEITWFLENICTLEWNEQQDAGKGLEEATAELLARHPEWETPIRAWYGRWEETISGPIDGSIDLLRHFRNESSYRLFALTNWSAETFPRAKEKFEFLNWFDGVLVSGEEKVRKPFPEIYRRLFERFDINPKSAVFIDDSLKNIEAAHNEGMAGVHFKSPDQVRSELYSLGVLKFPR